VKCIDEDGQTVRYYQYVAENAARLGPEAKS
jgi:hypothetical protein